MADDREMVDVDEGDNERDERVTAVVLGIRKDDKVVFEEFHLCTSRHTISGQLN